MTSTPHHADADRHCAQKVLQRKCFLVDSLLEERQKKLAAGHKNGNKPLELDDLAKEGSSAEDRERMPVLEEQEVDEDETLPNPHQEDQCPVAGEAAAQIEARGEEERRALLLDALAKLLPAVERGEGKNEENGADSGERTAENDGQMSEAEAHQISTRLTPKGNHQPQHQEHQQMAIVAATAAAAAASMEFLKRAHAFQQHLTGQNGALRWPSQRLPEPNQFHAAPFLPPIFQNNSPVMRNLFAPAGWQMAQRTEMTAPTAQQKPRRETANNGFSAAAQLYANGPAAAAALASIAAFKASSTAAASNGAIGNSANGPRGPNPTKRARFDLLRSKNSSRTASSHARMHHNGGMGTSRSSNAKKYRCDICEKTFSRSNTLITHKRIHTGEKPFRCEHCGRAFRQPGNLTRHAYTHTTVKPFVCAECGKAFNRASNLQTHVRVHAIEQQKGGAAEDHEEDSNADGQRQKCASSSRAEKRSQKCKGGS